MERCRTRYLLRISFGLLLSMIFITSASADFISLTVGTNSSSWSIYRHSANLSFDYSQSVQGTISPVDYKGRSLSPYHSSYEEVDVNDLRLRDRTSALQGSYSSEERMDLHSEISNPHEIEGPNKPAGTKVFTVKFIEQWPVILRSSKTIEYSGKGINNREFAGNNLDYAGSNLLYNKELSKETYVGMLLTKMNATVLATDDSFISADFLPEKEMYYDTRTYTTGIADMKYRQTGSSYDFNRGNYQVFGEGEERYYGSYNITRSIHMKSYYLETAMEEDWLPCCFSVGNDINLMEEKDYGVSPREVFDCTCDRRPADGKIAKSATTP
jgi:hypothetical protein